MKAYAYIGPFQSNFSKADFVNTIKTKGFDDFSKLPWEQGNHYEFKRLFISEEETLYLYGGREAVADALEKAYNITDGAIQGRISGSQLNLFRAQRTVARGLKFKNILMLTARLADDKLTDNLRKRKLEYHDNANSNLFKELPSLVSIIRSLPPLKD